MERHDTNLLQSANVTKSRLHTKTVYAYIVLIILQFYLVPLASFISGTDVASYATYMHFYTISSYTIIALGIIILHANGIMLFRDYFTLLTIAASCFLSSILKGDYELIYKIYMNCLGVALLLYTIVNRKRLFFSSLKSATIGFFWSASTVFILAVIYAAWNPVHGSLPADISTYIVNMFAFQLPFVAVIEEAIFRGLLFGFMVMIGYKENTALFTQAILFWGYHYMDIANPVLFFITIPLFTLSATLLIKKYKTLYLSIIMHLFVNVFVRVLVAMF